MKLGDKEVEYNYDFRFYITTKLSNPHYSPEIATKTTICNFAVKEQGLEAQLLGTTLQFIMTSWCTRALLCLLFDIIFIKTLISFFIRE